MRKILGWMLLTVISLTSCATHQEFSQVNRNWVNETWINQVNVNSDQWVADADRWFLTGEPNRIEAYVMNAPINNAISTMKIRVANFTSVIVNGPFQVQLVGTPDRNSVVIVGPNDQLRQLAVDVNENTISIQPNKGCTMRLDKIIVRIGVNNLRNLKVLDGANVYGRGVYSDNLSIFSLGSGKIYLSGNMNLSRVNQNGAAKVVVLGANTPSLTAKVTGNSSLNICGHVGVEAISHYGNGNVTIAGVDTDSLVIYTSGKGTTSLAGYANLKTLTALDQSRVYLYWVNARGTYVTVRDKAEVGLAGYTQNLNLEAFNSANFFGEYLHGDTVYARAADFTHANISANKKLFASSYDNSSIYFFGSPNIVTRFSTRNGTVVPVWNDATVPRNVPLPSTGGFGACSNFNYAALPMPMMNYKNSRSHRRSYKGEDFPMPQHRHRYKDSWANVQTTVPRKNNKYRSQVYKKSE